MRFWFSFVLPLGCNTDKTNTTIQVEEVARDNDGDGFTSDDDCDDSNSTINPGKEELCDGIDNNCDGSVDEDVLSSFYADSDNDGYGNPDITTLACHAPAGFVDTGSDCNDTDRNTYPSAEEFCDGQDNNCDGEIDEGLFSEYFIDADNDGFGDGNQAVQACSLASGLSAIGGDCNDADAQISPVAAELCDGIDNDCDDAIDEGVARVFYADSDDDGYGDEDNTLEACSLPTGYVENTLDCDDTDSQVNPAADERCDDQDNDCDGTTDEDFSIDALLFFADNDGDGHGNLLSHKRACYQPSGFVSNATDCDDTNSLIHPQGNEYCNGVDDDCDNQIDESDATNAFVWYADYDNDGYGDASASTSACTQPTDHISVAGDCDDNDNDIHPAAIEICDEEDNNCDGIIDIGSADLLTYYLDADGDGFGDGDAPLESCDQPSDYTLDDQDCDDGDADIHPDAIELYYDGIDQNCDEASDFDQDGDGVDSIDYGGLDLNDQDATCDVSCQDGQTQEKAGYTCKSILDDFPNSANGSYYIDLDADDDTSDAFMVYCDMNNGGWTYESNGIPFGFDYTGAVQTLETAGIETEYLFTLYGAQAGDGQNDIGGRGGMVEGSKTFGPSTTLFVYVGGKGDDGGAADSGACSTRVGGYNGGGRGSQGGSGGGGATDIRTANTLSDRILVAGGGGGCGGQNCYGYGGHGGGLTGENGEHVGSGLTDYVGGTGGTQSVGGSSSVTSAANGSFGVGGSNAQCNDEAGGGGGWYGGAAGGGANTSGGGGSSYYDGMDGDQSTSPGVNTGHGYVEYIFR